MTLITHDEVRHIAHLARLKPDDNEVERFTREITSILKYVDQLQNVDTKHVDVSAQIINRQNVLRDDIVRTQCCAPDSLLTCSPLPIKERQIQTPSAHE
jgi:aspartyl-tRNA(Asn)/glutamyl-tRNA(Gln) amidotransferase subunit C